MKFTLVKLLFPLLFLNLKLLAQDSIRQLPLEEARKQAITHNEAINQANLDVSLAKNHLTTTQAFFLPQANFSYTAISTNNPLNAFGLKLQQSTILASDFNPSLLNDPPGRADFSTKLELQQPLINLDLLYQRKGAAKQVEMYELMAKRGGEKIALETEKAYLQLQMLYEADKVLKEALSMAKAFQKLTKDLYDQGLVQRSDLLNADLHVSNTETQIRYSSSNILDASDMLSLMMGASTGTRYITDPIIRSTTNSSGASLSPDRADLLAMKKGIETYDLMIRSSKMSFLPKLNAFGNYQLNDNSVFGFKANSYLAGLQLSWNIFNGNKTKNQIGQQKLEKEKLNSQLAQQTKEAEMNIARAQRQIDDAAFSIKQQELAIGQAAEVLRVLQNRYTQGLVKTTDVLSAQITLSQQKLGSLQAILQFNTATATLAFLTSHK